ncbi:MAG: hypothetical protein AAB656_02025 [Patescibacteria group bacterium]
MKKNVFLLIFCLFLLILAVVLVPRVVKIKRIVCESQFGPCSEIITKKFQEFENKSLVKSRSDIANFLKKDIKVSRFSTRFELPDKIKVYVIEEKSFTALGRQGQEKYALINKNGEITSLESKTLLPTINLNNDSNFEFKIRDKVPGNIVFAASIAYEVFRQYQIRLVILNKDSIEVVIKGTKVYFPTEGDIDELLGAMNLILSRLNNGDISFRMREVDLRYKNPVVR